ncbi:MAG: DivIVA domain-containing protein [Candidatus Cyclonatronum sp.]|uniref:DivIVA domain-containing protein n=1 Tax=Cyclonatronum sp. TaxID=3024185 RepID=UPI0025B9A847|nr:DivIVA domain-containing protein [Cyclonatronum sp.]MCC5932995.1 DivIVA domain-containing protein [Balneolales bacterium]MCH8485288.1 DivIVA domain-containing protein [Cyclonatronum sp.]
MTITALDIKQRNFSKSLRGYDPAEVNAFLNMLANEWEHQVTKIKSLERDVREVNDKLSHYQRIEATLHETLQTARENAEQKMENARRDAKNKLQKAEIEAEQVIKEARMQKQHIRQSILKLLERREEIIRGMSSYLDVAQKSLDSFHKDGQGVYQLPRDEAETEPLPVDRKKDTAAGIAKSAPGTEDIDDLIEELD